VNSHNVLHCMNRYSAITLTVLFERLVFEYATKDISIQHKHSVDLLRECIMIRDNVLLCLFVYTVGDIHCIILYISTVYFTTIVSHVLQILQETKKLFRTVQVNIPTANFISTSVEELAGYGCHVYFS